MTITTVRELDSFIDGITETGSGSDLAAAGILNRIMSVEMKSLFDLYSAGTQSLSIGDYDSAYYYLNQAVSYAPDFIAALVNRGYLYRITSQPNESLKTLERARRIAPEDIWVWKNLADLYYEIEHEDKVMEKTMQAYRHVIELNPSSIPSITARSRLADILIFLYKDYVEAEQLLKSAIDLIEGLTVPGFNDHAWDDERVDIYRNFGYVYNRVNAFEKSISYFKLGLKIKPDDYELNELLKAAKYFKKHPDDYSPDDDWYYEE